MQKKSYSSPVLTCFGKVSDLTLVKSTGPSEGKKGTSLVRKGGGKSGILPGMDGGGF
ncbi:MAG: hypothetical protein ACI9R3_005046 [Verrucomicrobiales bacterium]|jgi:hypothetical protein